MLPTFVIGLREGVEAALIVGIIAGFLRQEGRRDALRPMWLGVGAAIGICVAVGVALELLDEELPQRQQEGLETVVGIAAIGIVTFMIVWMRRHARGLSGQLREARGAALAAGSTRALVAMAFFAVIREGLETVVFLLAVFQNADDPGDAPALGAVLGLAVRGRDRRADLPRRRQAQPRALLPHHRLRARARRRGAGGERDPQRARGGLARRRPGARRSTSRWLVVPGTWTSALLTGMLGWQPQPTYAEVIGYLALPRPRHALRAVAGAARHARGAHRRARRRCCSCSCWRSPPAARAAATRPATSKQVELKLTDAGCSPADAQARRGPHDLQGHERRHRPRQRARGADRARASSARRRTSSPASPARSRSRCSRASTRSAAQAGRPPRPAW